MRDIPYRSILLGLAFLVSTPLLRSAPPETVELKVVKMSDLETALKAQHGKIVVLDFWAEFCAPCKKELPHLIGLQKKYEKDVVVITLTVDEKAKKDKALAFLKSKKINLVNYLIDEEAEVYQKKFDMIGPPTAVIFDREGKQVLKIDDDPALPYSAANIEKSVKELLKKKP